jgi:hypothetical protein
VHANDVSFFDEINMLVQKEPPEALDPERVGQLAGIGIVHGQPFEPSQRRRAALEQAARFRAAISRALVYSARDDEAPIAAASSWLQAFIGGSFEFLRDGARLLDACTAFHYFATVITPAMAHAQVGAGSAYAYTVHDADGEILDGAKTYTVTLPPDPLAKDFWSIDVYDTQTRSLLQTDNPYPSVMSLGDTVAANDDGSYTIYRTVSALAGKEANWIQTVPARAGSRCCADTGRSTLVRHDMAAVRRHTPPEPRGSDDVIGDVTGAQLNDGCARADAHRSMV